jgi:putative transposase
MYRQLIRVYVEGFRVLVNDKVIFLQFIQPGKPMQNGFIKSFKYLYREAVQDVYIFFEINKVRIIIQE